MNILHLVNNLDCGGLERFAIDLARQTKDRGHGAEICCLEHAGELAAAAQDAGITVTSLDRQSGFDVKLIWRLARRLRKSRIDVIHTHNKAPLIYGSLAAWIARTRANVHTRHGREDKATHRLIWALNDHVVTISEDTRDQVVSCNPVDPSKVSVIPNGIPVGTFNQAKESHELPEDLARMKPDSRRIGIVARLAVEKDHATLLKAFALVVAELEDVKLIVVGDGPLMSDLVRQSSELGISKHTFFAGFRPDVERWLAGFDIFVLSSTTEGMSLTLLEAMAASIPIVATDVGGNAEVVQHDVTGFIVPARDYEALAARLATLLSDPSLRERMGQAGYERVRSLFNVEAMTTNYLDIYRKSLRS